MFVLISNLEDESIKTAKTRKDTYPNLLKDNIQYSDYLRLLYDHFSKEDDFVADKIADIKEELDYPDISKEELANYVAKYLQTVSIGIQQVRLWLKKKIRKA